MRLDLSPDAKDARSAALMALFPGGTVTIYTAPAPAPGGTATTLLLSYTLATPAGTVTAGAFTATTPITGAGLANGIAAWGRLADSSGNWVLDGDTGVTGSDNLFTLESTTVATGATIALLSLTLTEP
jgi:hypothetical protein